MSVSYTGAWLDEIHFKLCLDEDVKAVMGPLGEEMGVGSPTFSDPSLSIRLNPSDEELDGYL